MAIQVNGTTVIDNSRNLTNIGTVTATSYTGDGSGLTGISAAAGGGSDAIFYENGQTITSSYTIPSDTNAITKGAISINTGATVTINDGTYWSVL